MGPISGPTDDQTRGNVLIDVSAAADKDRVSITGILPPLPTPFRDGRVDLDSLKRHLDELFDSVDGVLLAGSTAEAPSLTIDERQSIVKTVARHFAKQRSLAVSIADNSIENSRRLADTACECGADLIVLSCPNYFPNSLSMLQSYFAAIDDFVCADICLYDNPIASNTTLSVSDIVALVATTPRLTHVKMTDTSLGKVTSLRQAADVTVFAGDDSVLWHQLADGAEGIMTASPMIYPERVATMWRSFLAGNRDEAYDEYRTLSHFIHSALTGADYPAVVKAVLYQRGVIATPDVRRPLLPLSQSRYAEVVAAL